jgi:hypothetical protein
MSTPRTLLPDKLHHCSPSREMICLYITSTFRGSTFQVVVNSCAGGPPTREKIVSTMDHIKYPRLSVRLPREMRRRVHLVAMSRNVTKSRVVRDALTQYFQGSNLSDSTIRDYKHS